MRTGIKRKDGFRLALALAVLIALLLSVTGCDPCARLSRRCPPRGKRAGLAVATDTVVKVRLERETIKETALPTDTGTMPNIMHNCFVSSINGRFVLELRTFRFGDYKYIFKVLYVSSSFRGEERGRKYGTERCCMETNTFFKSVGRNS